MTDQSSSIYDAFTSRENILFHGPAGTGKTYSINELISSLKMRRDEDTSCLYVTAPTGMAANHINGTTIHFNFGLGMIKTNTEFNDITHNYDYFEIKERKGLELKFHMLVDAAVKKSSFKDKNLEFLFIDEISMVGATLLIILDAILRNVIPNGSDKPMGGIQCVFCGDFYQLPPVKDEYCCFTKVWEALNVKTISMLECKRFGDDIAYFDMILRLRRGELTNQDKTVLMSRVKAFKDKEHLRMLVPPLELHPYNDNVKVINRQMLSKIDEPEYRFEAIDNIVINDRFIKGRYDRVKVETEIGKLLDNSMHKYISIRKGAQMILVHNYSVADKLSNGRMFKVLSIDRVADQQYLGNIRVTDQHNDQDEQDYPSNESYFNNIKTERVEDGVIVVKDPTQYTITILINDGTVHTIKPKLVGAEHRKFSCSRLQFPCMLAWAVTCHRSQGQTLESAIVNVSSSFAAGQSYVALSRVTKLENLFVSGINFNKIIVDNRIKAMFD